MCFNWFRSSQKRASFSSLRFLMKLDVRPPRVNTISRSADEHDESIHKKITEVTMHHFARCRHGQNPYNEFYDEQKKEHPIDDDDPTRNFICCVTVVRLQGFLHRCIGNKGEPHHVQDDEEDEEQIPNPCLHQPSCPFGPQAPDDRWPSR